MLKTENIKFSYVKEKILKGIDIEIKSGAFIGIIGPNASGKSTLLNLLGALDNPTEGEIYLVNR